MTEIKSLVTSEKEADFRQLLSYLFSPDTTTGVALDGILAGLSVAQTTTASASVDVAAGAAVVQDTRLAGLYPLLNNSTRTLNVLTANPVGGLPRNDLVVFDYATLSDGTGGIRAIIGTPNASPSDPTVPATAVRLARLRHAASATTIPAAKIDDLRAFTELNLTSSGKSRKAGRVTVPPRSPAESYSNVDVTFATPFPAGSTVLVFTQSETSVRAASPGAISVNGFTINVRNLTGANVTSDTVVGWHAVVAS